MAIQITIAEAQAACGTLSGPSKMPGKGTSTPATACITGSKLREVPGSVCEGCYAMSGMYLMSNVRPALENRLNLVMESRDNPEPWIAGMVRLIWNQEYFRWHDSGDLQGAWHFANIVEVARRTPHVKHWIPSREYRMVTDYVGDIPANIAVRLSAHMVDGPPPTNLGFPTSTVVTDGTHNCPANTQWIESPNKKTPETLRFGKLGRWSRGNCSGMNDSTGQWEDCRKCWDTDNANTSYPKH
jgi:hypothetical protein